jgi:hypothetical protein
MQGGNCKVETVETLLRYFDFGIVSKKKEGKFPR